MDVTSYLLGKKAGGGSTPVLQDKEVEITQNGETTITADSGYDGLSSVDITTNVPSQKYAPRYISFAGYPGSEFDYEIENLDTKNLTLMQQILSNCSNLASADISGWDASNVVYASNVFADCSNLISVNANNLITSKTQYITGFFYNCKKLTNVSVENWDTSGVLNMMEMFRNCEALTTLDISSFTSTSLTNCSKMFTGCKNLRHIDMRSFNFTKSGMTTTELFGFYAQMGDPPNDCEIIVADATQKAWINTNFSRLTNVKTVAEYEGS